MQTGRPLLIALTAVFLAASLAARTAALAQLGAETLLADRPCPSALPFDLQDGGCFCDPNPCLIGDTLLDVLVLTRSSPDPQGVLFAGSPSNPVLNAKDLGFDPTAGLRVNVTFASECGCDLQFSYFGLHGMDASEIRDDAGLFYMFYRAVPVTPATAYTVTYESHLDSAELNVRTRQWSRVAPMVGLRITQLEEVFNIVETADTSAGVSSEVENEMYGIQFGAQVLLCRLGRSRLETLGKAGVFFNDIAVSARAADASGTPLELDRDFYHTAFSGEVHLTWVYQFSECLLVRLGYQALWLDGIGLAPDQSDNLRVTTGEGPLDLGHVLYQGGYVGVEATW